MTFLVAELGVNWDGNFELLDKMMDSSKKVGFNAIKLQCFDQNNVKKFY